MEKADVVKQTRLAFDLIQRLYLETSYFIKEIEGILQREEEEFQILRPAGYAISTTRSVGLESTYVEQWSIRKGAVFFVPRADTELTRGQTITKFSPDLRVIIVRFVLYDKDVAEPEVWAGVIYNITPKVESSKFELYGSTFSYYDKKIMRSEGESTYEDREIAFKLNLIKKPLYDMSNAEDIYREIVEPVLALYKKK